MKLIKFVGGVLLLATAASMAEARSGGPRANFNGATRGAIGIPNGGWGGFPVFGSRHYFGSGFSSAPFGQQEDMSHRGLRPNERKRGFVPIWGYWGDGDGYAESETTLDTFGYFATGGSVDLVEGEPVYRYDRSYPYEWYGDVEPIERSFSVATQAYRCEFVLVPGESRSKRSTVRVCRR